MTDRADATVWLLSHNGTEDRIMISDEITPTSVSNRSVYGPFEGPWLPGEPSVRIFIRGGRLGYEVEELPPWLSDRDQHRVMSRLGVTAESFELIVPSTWVRFDDELGYKEFVF